MTIDEFDFSDWVQERLLEKGIHTIGDLKDKTACELGFPSKSSDDGTEEFVTQLGKYGIRMKAQKLTLENVTAVMLGHAIADAMGVPVGFGRREELAHYSRLFDPAFCKLPEAEIESSGYVVATLEAAV